MKWLLFSSIYFLFYMTLAILTALGTFPAQLFFILFFIPILVALIIKVIWECRTYGKEKVFEVLKETMPPADKKDVFLKSLQSQINSQVFISDINPRMIVIVNTNGIFLYSFIQDVGTFYEKDNIWYLKDGREEIEIENPIDELEQEKLRIENKLGSNVLSYIVLDSSTHFSKGSKNYQTLHLLNAPYCLCKTDILVRLTEEEINDIIEKIKNLQYKDFKDKEEGMDKC